MRELENHRGNMRDGSAGQFATPGECWEWLRIPMSDFEYSFEVYFHLSAWWLLFRDLGIIDQ